MGNVNDQLEEQIKSENVVFNDVDGQRTVTETTPKNEPQVADQLLDTIFAQKFRVTDLLGQGGMSVVYRAVHLAMNKEVALKVLHTNRNSDLNTAKRFRQEAQAASALSHPNIVAVSDCGVSENGIAYLVMEFVTGRSLSQVIKEDGPLDFDRFLHIMQQVSAALAHAHEKGVVHRDLKPSNIMISQSEGSGGRDHVQIVDFGIAKVMTQSGEGLQQLTATGEVFGSPLYMSPEQCTGSHVDQRSDIYSFGCVMYEALSGRVPHLGESVFDTINRHINTPPPPLVAPQLSDEDRLKIEVILLRALAKAPEDRQQSMSEIEFQLRAMKLKVRSGTDFFGKFGSAWQLAAAKRRAEKKNRLPLMVLTLSTVTLMSFVSIAGLVYALGQAESQLRRQEHARQVVSDISLTQMNFLHFAEWGRQFLIAAFAQPSKLPECKARFLFYKMHTIDCLDALGADLKDDPKLYAKFQNKWRPGLLQLQDLISDKLMPLEHHPDRDMTIEDISYSIQLAKISSKGSRLVDEMTKQAQDNEQEKIGKFKSTEHWIRILAFLCVALNGAVSLSILAYFIKGTPKRLKEVAQNAARISRSSGLAKPIENDDEIAELDNVLNELASALSEAEKREELLLQKLNKHKNQDDLPA